jgi:hypothetical protein
MKRFIAGLIVLSVLCFFVGSIVFVFFIYSSDYNFAKMALNVVFGFGLIMILGRFFEDILDF